MKLLITLPLAALCSKIISGNGLKTSIEEKTMGYIQLKKQYI
jgi:hypothetical protein